MIQDARQSRSIRTQRSEAGIAMYSVHRVARVCPTPEPVPRRNDPGVAACADLAPEVQAQQTLERISALGAVLLLGVPERRADPVHILQPVRRRGQPMGNNYDPTGNNTQGRVTIVFRGNWAGHGLRPDQCVGAGAGGGRVTAKPANRRLASPSRERSAVHYSIQEICASTLRHPGSPCRTRPQS